MYTVRILDKSKKNLREFLHVSEITYSDYVSDIILKGEDILKHSYSLTGIMHFYSETGNYTVTSDIIGTLEIEKEC